MNNFNKQIKNLTNRWLSKQKISEVLNVDENVINQTLEEIGMKEEADAHEKLIKNVEGLYNKGTKPESIAISLGVNLFQVKHIINNLPKKKEEIKMEEKKDNKIVKTWSRWTEEEVDKMKNLKKKGYSLPQIAVKMKKTERQVSGAWRRYVLHPDQNIPPVPSLVVINDVKTNSPKKEIVVQSPVITEFKMETKQEEISPIVITIDRGNKLDIIEYLVKNKIKATIQL